MVMVVCPYCHSPILFPDQFRGTKGTCPNCAQTVVVPTVSATLADLREVLGRKDTATDGRRETDTKSKGRQAE